MKRFLLVSAMALVFSAPVFAQTDDFTQKVDDYVKQVMDISESHAYKMYLYRIVPTISYKVKF